MTLQHLNSFSLKDMTETCITIRSICRCAETMEEAAQLVASFFYDQFRESVTESNALILSRVFITCSYSNLAPSVKDTATAWCDGASPEMKCLVLLGTRGLCPEWNSRTKSRGHQVIPLPSTEIVERAPMISNLMKQFGLELNAVIKPEPALILDLAQQSFNVFHVQNASGNSIIPAQEEFILRFGIRSVLGFGGMLPSGNLFAGILFSKTEISETVAEMFRPIALSLKIALLPFDGKIFISPGRTSHE